ncbi:hypothetical protein M752DRAFT_279007 [Aspergillus phoenicis ATCC 13157]|uniref:Uncharacterized protein n=1 Tax=Aspergillus phoenicis ATCC 13157 TaxID=1353007 RepID=A0A370P8D5_ASPPH|nr:hypothetical protein M752DRAFT_279007 [Aspergillus phoenicis ATCC 13157]
MLPFFHFFCVGRGQAVRGCRIVLHFLSPVTFVPGTWIELSARPLQSPISNPMPVPAEGPCSFLADWGVWKSTMIMNRF